MNTRLTRIAYEIIRRFKRRDTLKFLIFTMKRRSL